MVGLLVGALDGVVGVVRVGVCWAGAYFGLVVVGLGLLEYLEVLGTFIGR